ncbi:hypothetical protein [Paenibacillus lutrae]|uniref:Uncharacterized protein n=1 Tax=Paenibacillus lutrae TaxID=2078573 RepID=A0A7X3FIE8_9BACL|nr:hypothetical protein [Paenibacillus lutrae]MVP00359.1 hypothetical protein [Paenibacillus lutrae]
MERFSVNTSPDILNKLGREQAEKEAVALFQENIREAGEDAGNYKMKCYIDLRTDHLVCNADKIN